jgi:hypothetical protein
MFWTATEIRTYCRRTAWATRARTAKPTCAASGFVARQLARTASSSSSPPSLALRLVGDEVRRWRARERPRVPWRVFVCERAPRHVDRTGRRRGYTAAGLAGLKWNTSPRHLRSMRAACGAGRGGPRGRHRNRFHAGMGRFLKVLVDRRGGAGREPSLKNIRLEAPGPGSRKNTQGDCRPPGPPRRPSRRPASARRARSPGGCWSRGRGSAPEQVPLLQRQVEDVPGVLPGLASSRSALPLPCATRSRWPWSRSAGPAASA